MVFVDSNVFIIDRFYPRDALYSKNRSFIEKLSSLDAAMSILTLLEVCGGASHGLSAGELDDWLFRFDTIYPLFTSSMCTASGRKMPRLGGAIL